MRVVLCALASAAFVMGYSDLAHSQAASGAPIAQPLESPVRSPATVPGPSSAPLPAVIATTPTLPGLVHVAEGTQMRLVFNEHLSSATASEGDRFSVTLDEPVTLANGVVLPAGYHGEGEVTTVERKGMMGKAGRLNIRLNYLAVGDHRIRLRASRGATGQDSVGATVALTVLFGPIGLIKHGHDVDIQPGQTIEAFVDEPTDVPAPFAPPPPKS